MPKICGRSVTGVMIRMVKWSPTASPWSSAKADKTNQGNKRENGFHRTMKKVYTVYLNIANLSGGQI